jgi:hypothetical protein
MLGVLVLAACVHAPHTVPITIGPAHELIVPVVVDGEELRFQVDTGSSTTTIAPSARARLELPFAASPVHGAGAAGRIDHIERAGLGTAEIGDVRTDPVVAAVIDLGSDGTSDGLLGMDVLLHLTSEIDLVHDRFALYHANDRRWWTPDLVSVGYKALAGGQIAIDVVIDGHPATGILDFGANQSFANQLAAPARGDEAPRLLTATVGADGHPWRFRAFGDVPLGVGSLPLVAPTMLVADLPIFAELGLANRPTVIIGADLLAGRRVVIDPVDHRVYVSPHRPNMPRRVRPQN